MVFLKWVLLACFVCSCLGLQTPNLTRPCDPNDLRALKDFEGKLTNGSIFFLWSNDSHCCNWDGVGCEDSNNGSVASRVTSLVLPSRRLRGVNLRALGRLDHLKLLNLSCSQLDGELPLELSNLHQLEVLDLSFNKLRGPVSRSLLGLKSIKSLNISSNFFTGDLLEIGGFMNLLDFNISNNFFNGSISSQFCSSSNSIQTIDLSVNHFTGGLEGLSNCSSKTLQNLLVDYNSLSGQLPEFLFSLPSLEQLSISTNNFSGHLSRKLSKLHRLKSLVIFENRFSGVIPDVFGNLTQLEMLIAHSNSFVGVLPQTLALCSKLHVLDLRNNSLTGLIDLNFTGLPHLCMLDLATNHFYGSLPDTLSSCRELKLLSLAKNELVGQVPESFANLKYLSVLTLSNNSFVNLTGALSVLQQCKNLTTLILTKNFHQEEIPKNVKGFESLRIFALGNCALRGQIPLWLLNCKKLQVLDLSWNHLDGSIPPWIGQMENLFYLDFSNNSLTGGIPKSLTELKSLVVTKCSSNITTSAGIPLYVKRNQSANGLRYNQVSSFPPSIYLSNNRINGTIWPEIGKLKQLHVLDLSRNNITGTIPNSISNMENLEVLDLSCNDLYGEIPLSLNKLTFLSKFSVADNQLHGMIPTGGQFLSFPNSSFEGNPGLCGETYIPCIRADTMSMKPAARGSSNGRFGQGSIFGITISIGVGIALLLAVVWLRMSRKDVGVPIDDLDEEMSRPHRLSEVLGSSKLVLFQNSDCKDLSVVDLLKSTNNFNQANIIGCGGFGLVYKANLPDGTKAAVKRLSGDCGQMEREFRAEVEALSRAQHKNLVSLQGYCRHGNDRLLIYSYMENGSLDYWLHERVDGGSFLSWETRLKIAQGAGRGLAYLHKVCEPSVVHRDIKSSNILLDETFEAHLADFGLSRLLRPYDTHVTTDLVGTLGYIPPEYSQTLTATFKGDVYSFGVVLLELLTGRRPVEVLKGKNCRDLVSWVFQMKAEKKEEQIMDSSIWDKDREKQFLEVLGIACKCIDQDPRQRPSIDRVVSWLDAVGKDGV